MSLYLIEEVDGISHGEVLHWMNGFDPSFPMLEYRHLRHGYWWLVRTHGREIIGFAGLVPNAPHLAEGYLKRAYISPDHRGHGLQLKMIEARLNKARELGWHQVVAETKSHWSAHNLALAGFELVEPEQPWGEPGSLYFSKLLTL